MADVLPAVLGGGGLLAGASALVALLRARAQNAVDRNVVVDSAYKRLDDLADRIQSDLEHARARISDLEAELAQARAEAADCETRLAAHQQRRARVKP